MSKLEDFLKQQKIDSRRLIGVSHELESLRPEDRSIRLAKREVRGGQASDAVKEKAAQKGRGGRALSAPALQRALSGGKVSGPTKTRIVRAVNSVLTQRKKSEVALRDLF